MFIVDKKKIVHLMRDIYNHRLNEAMNEADIFDTRGNMVLGKDTKVRHKDTGFEYTVAGVDVDPEGSNTRIMLRLPDQPRIEPEGEEGVISDDGSSRFLGELDDSDSAPEGEDVDGDDVVFVIDKKEFEKDYEVQ